MIEIEWVTDAQRFAALGREWDRLTSGSLSPFGDHCWFAAWWEHFGIGELRVCVLGENGELRAALPLFLHRGRLNALANYHTPRFSVAASDHSAMETVVREAFSLPVSEVAVQPVALSDQLHEAVDHASARGRRRLLVEPLYSSPYVELDGDFESFMRGREQRLKGNLRRWHKLNREQRVRFRFEDSIEDLETELERGYAIEASGWKGERKTAILCSPQTRGFYTAIARAYHDRGQLRLAWLEIDGELAAFSFCLQRSQHLYCLKLGIEERLRRYAPGVLTDYATLEHCFGLGLERYDFLGADEPYKRYFATGATDVVRLRSYRRRSAASVRYLTRRYGRPAGLAVRSRMASRYGSRRSGA
jgi:CelD/BcsL family acetyltransferase involved in cellulose biosynthesis